MPDEVEERSGLKGLNCLNQDHIIIAGAGGIAEAAALILAEWSPAPRRGFEYRFPAPYATPVQSPTCCNC